MESPHSTFKNGQFGFIPAAAQLLFKTSSHSSLVRIQKQDQPAQFFFSAPLLSSHSFLSKPKQNFVLTKSWQKLWDVQWKEKYGPLSLIFSQQQQGCC